MQAVGKKLESDLADLKSRLKAQEMETRVTSAAFSSAQAFRPASNSVFNFS